MNETLTNITLPTTLQVTFPPSKIAFSIDRNGTGELIEKTTDRILAQNCNWAKLPKGLCGTQMQASG